MTRWIFVLLLALLLSPLARPQEPPAEPDPVDAGLTALMAESREAASRIRELPFLADVPVRRLRPEDLEKQILRDLYRLFGEGEELRAMEELLFRLGLIPKDLTVEDLIRRFFPRTVAANYDPFERRIAFLRGFRSKSIMVHELTHALQDQHYNLSMLLTTRPATFDSLLALGALVEGDAETVQQYFDRGPAFRFVPIAMIRTMAEQQIDAYLTRMAGFPRAVARPFIFQYLDGLLFVETIRRQGGGFAAIDRVFADPPETTEQILHPERYLDRDRPTRITPVAPPAGWRLRVENVLGELGVRIVLEQHLGRQVAARAAAGWDGDRVLLLAEEEGPGVAVVWYTTWDTERDAEEFFSAAVEMFRKRRPEAEVRELEERGLALQIEDEEAFGAIRAGRDVLVVLGAPREGAATFLARLLPAEKVKLTERRTRFGER